MQQVILFCNSQKLCEVRKKSMARRIPSRGTIQLRYVDRLTTNPVMGSR